MTISPRRTLWGRPSRTAYGKTSVITNFQFTTFSIFLTHAFPFPFPLLPQSVDCTSVSHYLSLLTLTLSPPSQSLLLHHSSLSLTLFPAFTTFFSFPIPSLLETTQSLLISHSFTNPSWRNTVSHFPPHPAPRIDSPLTRLISGNARQLLDHCLIRCLSAPALIACYCCEMVMVDNIHQQPKGH